MIVSRGYGDIVHHEVPERDGAKMGLWISEYCGDRDAYRVLLIRWIDGAALSDDEEWIDRTKIGYRYDLSRARPSKRKGKATSEAAVERTKE